MPKISKIDICNMRIRITIITIGIGIMYKARQFLSNHALLDLYYAYIYPYMTYCIEVWGCASQTQLNCIFLLQK